MSFSQRGGWWVVAQLGLFALFGWTLIDTDPLSGGFGIGYARVVGVVLVVAATAVAMWAMALHGRSLSPFPAPVAGMPLIDRGPYRLVRHPIYGAISVGAIGLGLALANPWAVTSAFLFPVFFTAKCGHEEELLVEAVPGYRDYRSRVPHRLIPYIL